MKANRCIQEPCLVTDANEVTREPKETTHQLAHRDPKAIAAGTPNPQGKGLVGFLLDWDYSAPRGVVAKPKGRILSDYFTTLLILSAAFKFKPAFETDYYLYSEESGWALSLISPAEWNTTAKRGAFVGRCVLHADSTWSIEPSENLKKSRRVAEAVGEAYDAFVERLDTTSPLEDELPFYEAKLPYYQRLFAAALSRSLRASLTYGDQNGQPSRQWLELLPRDVTRVLTGPTDQS